MSSCQNCGKKIFWAKNTDGFDIAINWDSELRLIIMDESGENKELNVQVRDTYEAHTCLYRYTKDPRELSSHPVLTTQK